MISGLSWALSLSTLFLKPSFNIFATANSLVISFPESSLRWITSDVLRFRPEFSVIPCHIFFVSLELHLRCSQVFLLLRTLFLAEFFHVLHIILSSGLPVWSQICRFSSASSRWILRSSSNHGLEFSFKTNLCTGANRFRVYVILCVRMFAALVESSSSLYSSWRCAELKIISKSAGSTASMFLLKMILGS